MLLDMFRDFLFATIICGAPLLIIEATARFLLIRIKGEVLRKLIHVGSSLSVIVAAHLFGLMTVRWVALLFSGLLLAAHFMFTWRALATPRRSYGELLFAPAVGLTAVVAINADVFTFAVLALGFVDTAAFAVGRRFPLWRPKNARKSLGGFLAAMLTSLLLIGAFFDAAPATSLVSATLLALAEWISFRGSDNLSIPLVAVLLGNLFI